jgi:hypothetical protein
LPRSATLYCSARRADYSERTFSTRAVVE